MAQVPDDERIGRADDGAHVAELRGPIVDVRQAEDPVAGRVDGGLDRIGFDVLAAELAGDPLEHVAVGREVGRIGDDRSWPVVGRGMRQLVEVDRHRIGDEHLARPGAERY